MRVRAQRAIQHRSFESVPPLSAGVSAQAVRARVPWPFSRETREGRWDVSLSTAALVHRERARRSAHRSRRDGRRRVGDLFNTVLIATLDERHYIIRG